MAWCEKKENMTLKNLAKILYFQKISKLKIGENVKFVT